MNSGVFEQLFVNIISSADQNRSHTSSVYTTDHTTNRNIKLIVIVAVSESRAFARTQSLNGCECLYL